MAFLVVLVVDKRRSLETKAFAETEKAGDKEQYTAAVGATGTWYLVFLVNVLVPQTSIIGGRRSRRI